MVQLAGIMLVSCVFPTEEHTRNMKKILHYGESVYSVSFNVLLKNSLVMLAVHKPLKFDSEYSLI